MILEWVKAIGSLLISWPVVVLIMALLFRKQLLLLVERFRESDEGKIELGSVKIELGKLAREGHDAVNNLNRINVLMAESRLLELEITENNFGGRFTAEQRERMKQHIAELKRLIASAQVGDDGRT